MPELERIELAEKVEEIAAAMLAGIDLSNAANQLHEAAKEARLIAAEEANG